MRPRCRCTTSRRRGGCSEPAGPGRYRTARSPSADLAWFVREAWPSPVTGAELTAGTLTPGLTLEVVVQSGALITFGDGLEADRLTATWGQTVHVERSERHLRLVV